MATSRLIDEANRKGYSGILICDLLNRRGVKVQISRFRKAVVDKPNKTAREQMITDEAFAIVKALPDFGDNTENFASRAKKSGLTVRAVWEYYNRTHDKQYAYCTFSAAVSRKESPFERKLAEEAERCLAEMTKTG